jgi:hypothetical protein
MSPNTHTDIGDALSWLGAANTALGTLTMMLFPLALPILLLTVAFTVPLLLLAIPLAIPVGIVLLVRRIVRGLSGRAPRAPERHSQGRSGSWRAAPGPQAR